MFLKKLQRHKNGKSHVYWALVESARTPRGPRNREGAYLGEHQPHKRKGWTRLASTLGSSSPTMVQRSHPAHQHGTRDRTALHHQTGPVAAVPTRTLAARNPPATPPTKVEAPG